MKHLGVSNFGIEHLKALEDNGRPLPTVNQIEIHPLNYKERKGLLDYCAEKGIIIQVPTESRIGSC